MKVTFLNIKQSLNKAYLKEKLSRSKLADFKNNLTQLMERIDEHEYEENAKKRFDQFFE
jgi:hypothetical protein